MVIASAKSVLDELVLLLEQLDEYEYSFSRPVLNNSSIGEHCRHIIEMFECLLSNYEKGKIDYDKRNRNKRTETETCYAIIQIKTILHKMDLPDKPLRLQFAEGFFINSNYEREVLYNFEHCIHHQALIKIAVQEISRIELPDTFGVAPSTIAYRKNLQELTNS